MRKRTVVLARSVGQGEGLMSIQALVPTKVHAPA